MKDNNLEQCEYSSQDLGSGIGVKEVFLTAF